MRNVKKKTTDQFKTEVHSIVGDEYSVIGFYVNAKTRLEIRHNTCSFEYLVTPTDFLSGRRCPKCSGKWKYGHDEFVKRVHDIHGDEYTVIGGYMATRFPVEIRHNICGNEYYAIPNNILRGATCLKCSDIAKGERQRKDIIIFKQQVYGIVGTEYEVIGDYKTSRTNILVKHNMCKNEYKVTPDNFLRGKRCPFCSQSRGEKLIASILDQYNVDYKTEYRFSDCRDIRPLPFDFAIFDKDKIVLLVEFDGVQHFEAQKIFGGKKALLETQRRDKIKTRYCQQRGLRLLRFAYTLDDETITNALLCEFGL